MEWLRVCNIILGGLFTLCYAYQFFYLFWGTVNKPRSFAPCPQRRRYAVMVAGRNESAVIGNLLDSINGQNYPSSLVQAFVVADNCTDDTAAVAAHHGAEVYVRFNHGQIGKGYALDFLFGQVQERYGEDYFDGYFIVDADNLLAPDYITEMDKCFNAGHRIITSYRNSKNYRDNWISSGYALWFLREARHLNNSRFLLGTSCAVSGTGFLVHKDIIKRQGGWKHFLLVEDIEFTVDQVLQGEKVAYCHSAMLYDEQPTSFRQSWRQRMRWTRGYLQILGKYGFRMLAGVFGKNGFSCFDMAMTIAPAYILSTACFAGNLAALVLSLMFNPLGLGSVAGQCFTLFNGAYGLVFLLGLTTGVCEWKNINCSAPRKLWSFVTFPLFMLTYIPIAFTALFRKVEWKPITHSVSVTLDQVRAKN